MRPESTGVGRNLSRDHVTSLCRRPRQVKPDFLREMAHDDHWTGRTSKSAQPVDGKSWTCAETDGLGSHPTQSTAEVARHCGTRFHTIRSAELSPPLIFGATIVNADTDLTAGPI